VGAIENVLAEVARRQHGVMTRRQLLAAGVSRDTIDSHVQRLRLRVLHRGVYQLGPIPGPRAREMAAALACDGIVSHRTAVAMRQLSAAAPDAPIDVTISRERRVRRPGVRVHRCNLGAGDVESLDGVPVTALPRTLFDFAAVATSRELERVFALAERGDATLRRRLQELIERHPNRRGTRLLRELLRRDTPALTRSEAEELLLGMIRSGGIPEPLMNAMLLGYEVDCYWPDARLVAEVDGYAWHGSRRSFHRDRQRDSALGAAGIQVLRISWQQLTDERDRTLVELGVTVAQRTTLWQRSA
jgi:very-short-patch-repair endonuclease